MKNYMTNTEIIEELARNKVVEEIISNINRTETQFNIQDLVQDIYLSLLEKPTKKITEMYEKNQLKFYITRMVLNNIYSKLSPYYRKYKHFDKLIDDNTTIE